MPRGCNGAADGDAVIVFGLADKAVDVTAYTTGEITLADGGRPW